MAELTYFVVVPFTEGRKNRILAGEAREARDEPHARRLARTAAAQGCGAVAFARSGDPASGDWEDARILAVHGKVPSELEIDGPYEDDLEDVIEGARGFSDQRLP